MAIQPGRLLAERYRLVRTIGLGSQASVWVAEHLALSTQVAVKLIDPDLAKRADARERFRREATAAAQLRSAHVVQILDHGIDGDQPFIVMELLEGEDLFQRLEKRHHLSLRETSKIITQVARALTRAHAAGVVHRDLKPENVFLVPNEDDEVVKVLDFGVAKVRDAAKVTMQKTGVGTLIGTPHYMSPEQVKGIGEVDFRTDIWALGVIAYQCMTGDLPFDSEGVGDLLIKITIGDIPVPSKVLTTIPAAFDGWFARACERDITKRFASARAAAEALARVAGLGAAQAPAPVAGATVPRPGSIAPGAPSTPPPAAKGSDNDAARANASAKSAPAKPPGPPPPRASKPSAGAPDATSGSPRGPAPPAPPKPSSAALTPSPARTPPPTEESLDADDLEPWDEEPEVAPAKPRETPPKKSEEPAPIVDAAPAEPEPPASATTDATSGEPALSNSADAAPPSSRAAAPAIRAPSPPTASNPFLAVPPPRVQEAAPAPVVSVPQRAPIPAQAQLPAPHAPHSTVSGFESSDVDVDDEAELAFGKNRRKKLTRYFVVGLVALALGVAWIVVRSRIPTSSAPPEAPSSSAPTAPSQAPPPPEPTTYDPTTVTTTTSTTKSTRPKATGYVPTPGAPGTGPKTGTKKPDDGSVEIPTPPDDPGLPPPAP